MAKIRKGDLFSVVEEFDTAGELVDFADALLAHGLVSALDTFLVVEMRPGYVLIAPFSEKKEHNGDGRLGRHSVTEPAKPAQSGGIGGQAPRPVDLNYSAQVTDLCRKRLRRWPA